MDAIVETEQLSKSFGAVHALKECTLEVEAGQVFGLLGPNGAGKSTLIRLLLGFLKPTSGSARIAGFDSVRQTLKVRQNTAYLPGDARLFRAMRGRDVIDFFSSLRGTSSTAAHQLAQQIELDTARRVGWMSRGMRQKLALAIAVSSEPDVLILDEPTSGLDPNQIRGVRDTIRRLGQTKTILLSTHILQEVQAMCSRVVMINEGRLVYDGPLDEIDPDNVGLDDVFAQRTGYFDQMARQKKIKAAMEEEAAAAQGTNSDTQDDS